MAPTGYLHVPQPPHADPARRIHGKPLLAVFSSKRFPEVPMLQFVCDSCGAIKEPSEVWIVGLAAESVGVTSARRQVTIQSAWDRPAAVHPLAVHFCSVECKDNYMARLFAPEATAEEVVVETVPAATVVTTAPIAERRTTRRSTRTPARKRAA
jgi:hypothetical protein